MDTCPHCGGPARETGAIDNDRRPLMRCRSEICRGHHKWWSSERLVSKRKLFDRREEEARIKARQN